MKIIEVITDTNIGGAGVLLTNRMSCTDFEKYTTWVLLPRASKLIGRLAETGVKIIETDCKGDCSWSFEDVRKYRKEIRRISPDIINCHGSFSARVAAMLEGVDVKICTRHCVYPIKPSEKLFAAVNNGISNAFIAVAHSAKENLLNMGIDERKIHVIINGANALKSTSDTEKAKLREKLGISSDTTVLIMCARLEECKGHKYLLNAIKLLKAKGMNCVALLVGDGSQRRSLEEYCKLTGICDMVKFIGFAENVSPYMNIADININCSVGTETSSLSLSEGMSLSVPAIVSDYGGNPYMVKDGENGLVYPRGNSEALASCIQRLIVDRNIYCKMKINARERFENELNSSLMTEKTNELYDNLLRISRKAHLRT